MVIVCLTLIKYLILFLSIIIEIILIKISMKNTNLKSIIGLYIFLYLINSFLTTVLVGIASLNDTNALIVEIVVCVSSAIVVCVLSLSRIKSKIKHLTYMIPKIVKILMLALFFSVLSYPCYLLTNLVT